MQVPVRPVSTIASDDIGVVKVDSIVLDKSSVTLTLGETETLTLNATVAPADAADKTITWSSSDKKVATVNTNGQVTAVSAGIATITATANDGSGVSAQCEVVVTLAPCFHFTC